MDDQLKRRLIGATVLMSLAIIFLPMLLTHKPDEPAPGTFAGIPKEPPGSFDDSLLQDKPAQPALSSPAVAAQPAAQIHSPAAPQSVAQAKTPSRPKPVEVAVPPTPKAKPKPPVKQKDEVKALSGWVVQAASLSNYASAKKLVEKLRKAGFDTMNPKRVIVKGKRYYRVQVGPELNKHRAERLLPKIRKITKVQGRVVRYP